MILLSFNLNVTADLRTFNFFQLNASDMRIGM